MSDKMMRLRQLPGTANVLAVSSSRCVAVTEDPGSLQGAWPVEPAPLFVDPTLQAVQISPDRDRFGDHLGPGLAVEPEDGIVRSLCSALKAAEQGRDRPCADALRRAIAIRLAGLADFRAPADAGDLPPKTRPVRELQKWRLKRVVEYIDNHLSAKISLLDLAAVAGLSRMHFASQFRKATGVRPHEYLLTRRIRRGAELLRASEMPIVEIALTVGFQTQAHFTTVFKRFIGCTPCRWRSISREFRTDDFNRLEAPFAPAD
jgi:AraC family transcriptional regulator